MLAVIKKLYDKYSVALSPTVFFVIAASIFGFIFVLITPPFQGTDESAHFLRAYQISEGKFVVDSNNGRIGGKLPKSIYQTFVVTTTDPVVSFNPNTKYNEHKTVQALAIEPNSRNASQYDLSGTALYSPVSYVPASLAILISRICNFAPVISLYLARLAGLAAWVLLLGVAIRLMPVKKWALVFVGLLPMALFQASTLNTDAVTLGSVALVIAFILRLRAQKQEVTVSQVAWLTAIFSLVLLSKQAMFVFLPLLLLIPRRLFASPRTHLVAKIVLAGVPLLLLGAWVLLIRGISLDTVYGSANGQDPSRQLHFIVHQPIAYAYVLLSTVINTTGDGLVRSLVGTFGWFDTPLPWIIVVAIYGLLAILLLRKSDEKLGADLLGKKDVATLVLVFLLYWGAVNTSLYLYYTPVRLHYVYGLQGRYFIPLLVLTIPILYRGFLVYRQKTEKLVAIYGSIFMLSVSAVTIFSRYYFTGIK